MQTPIIVMGAAGRMGSTIVRLAREDAALCLAGRVEHAARLKELAPLDGCVDGDGLEAVLAGTVNPVIVDFTAPASSAVTAEIAAERGAMQVIGTTGFSDRELAALRACAAKTPIFWSPNMSVGVNVLLKILPDLVRLLGENYDMEMVEIHHNKKRDSPSGTALRLAEAMVKARDWDMKDVARCRREGVVGERPRKEMGLLAVRGGDVVGVHTAYFLGPGERIEVTHQAHSRENFAQGALRAAKWLAKQKAGRLYSMEDML
jgi:4-hydroxy-tetrahydrodipicolinate reductase